jgi:hypothetical protein
MPTTPIMTFGAGRVEPLKAPDEALSEVIGLKASTAFAAGTLVGEITASPGTYGPYATGNVDGTQNPTHILMYACITDASGNVTFGSSGIVAGGAEWGQTQKGAPAWASGEFSCADLVGLDAGAVTKMGRLIQGTVSSGRILVYGP